MPPPSSCRPYFALCASLSLPLHSCTSSMLSSLDQGTLSSLRFFYLLSLEFHRLCPCPPAWLFFLYLLIFYRLSQIPRFLTSPAQSSLSLSPLFPFIKLVILQPNYYGLPLSHNSHADLRCPPLPSRCMSLRWTRSALSRIELKYSNLFLIRFCFFDIHLQPPSSSFLLPPPHLIILGASLLFSLSSCTASLSLSSKPFSHYTSLV
jgi:hypothetical protein